MKPLASVVLAIVVLAAAPSAQPSLPSELGTQIDVAVHDVLTKTSLPSASVGIVRDGRIVFTKAYGMARIAPPMPASADMHYAVGSISKQFTAACILLLQQDGKLTIDDPVGKYLPELTRANDVKLRHILSHTSGYQDYAPQDYTIPSWTKPTTADAIVHEWATKPLDFEPGSQYQYSNTNFNIAGLIVEKASGEKFWTFLSRRVLTPLHLTRTIDLDTQHDQLEPTGYMRNALGPLRPAIMEAPGWYFADGELAMPVGDLLTWDVSLIDESLLHHDSYAAMETDQPLTGGGTAHYGLGVAVSVRDGRRVISHGGEVGGFVAQNIVYPDQKIAVAVLTNQEASSGASAIARSIVALLLPPATKATSGNDTAAAEAQAKRILIGLQQGKIERSLFTDNCNFYFDETAINDYASSLKPLGTLSMVKQSDTFLRGGMRFRSFDVTFTRGPKLRLTTFTTSDGKLEQFLIGPAG
ncbi:MAG TPA: serine hydrolase domain-containing protein [Vicinamibacterales bacterium]|nr:serine hydrolase domain-containing protein [Vicinamibacterales bacterium]